MRMAKEIADTGRPQIHRPDRDELLAIKAGRFAYEDLMVKAAVELESIDESFAVSQLQDEPDIAKIEKWAVEIRKAWYSSHQTT